MPGTNPWLLSSVSNQTLSPMAQPEVIRFSSDLALAEAAASDWLQLVPTGVDASRPWLVALSGGRIARRFFQASVALCMSRDLSLNAIHFFWGDERCVPPDDAESNYRIARAELLTPLNISEQNIHRIRGEETPESAARAAAAELQRVAAVSATELPAFDLIFLGMGEDGHVASLFPGESPAAADSPALFRSVVAAKPPPNRITIGYHVIAAARRVWVMASGPSKSQALRESLKSEGQTPLARVIRSRQQTRILTDIPI
jgi:6-phosphogluconolactonase